MIVFKITISFRANKKIRQKPYFYFKKAQLNCQAGKVAKKSITLITQGLIAPTFPYR